MVLGYLRCGLLFWIWRGFWLWTCRCRCFWVVILAGLGFPGVCPFANWFNIGSWLLFWCFCFVLIVGGWFTGLGGSGFCLGVGLAFEGVLVLCLGLGFLCGVGII